MEQTQQNIPGSKKALFALAAGIGVYIGLRYLFPLVSPFLLSFCIVYLLNARLEKIQKKTHIRKEILLVGILILSVTGIFLLIGGSMQAVMTGAGTASADWDGIGSQIGGQIRIFLGDCCIFVENHFGIDAGQVEQMVLERVDVLIEELRVEFVPKLMTESWWYVKKLLSVGAFLGMTFIASILLCKDYDRIIEHMMAGGENSSIPGKVLMTVERVIRLAVVFVKTQGIIMIIIATVCCVGLWLGKVGNALLLGILAGVLDAFPFIGTGIILIPTALWQLICGRYGTAAWCLAVYVICIAVRELLEPRLIGEKTGIYPVFMLLAVYVGLKLFGVSGIVKGPFAAVILAELWKDYTKRI